MMDYNYTIKINCSITPDSPPVLGERFLRTLELMAMRAPEIGDWEVVDLRNRARLVSMDDARKTIAKIVVENVSRDDYDNADPEFGYHLLGVNTPTITPRSLNWSGTVGGKFRQRIEFEAGSIGVPPDPEIVTYPLFRTALLTTLELWPSNWANAEAYKSKYYESAPAPGIPPHPYSRFHIPWLSYLSAPLADGLDVPGDILCERTPDGGLLMIAAEERLDPTDPATMRRSRKMAEIMIARVGDPYSQGGPPVARKSILDR